MPDILQAKIMGEFSMPIIQTSEESGSKLGRSFLSWVVSNKRFVSNHTFAAYCFYKRMRRKFGMNGVSIIEYFGGAGISATIAEEFLCVQRHVVMDINPLAVQQLKLVEKLHSKMEVTQRSFEQWSDDNRDAIFDIHDLDNPCFTAAQLRHYHLELSRIFRSGPAVVKLTDIAGAKMGWNKKYFAKQFGQTFNTYDDYLFLTSHRIYDLFGYSAEFIYTYYRTAMMCLTEGWREPEMIALPDEPRGFIIENGLPKSQRNA